MSHTHDEETLTRKARTSISHFFSPNLKRKRSFSIHEQEEEPIKKKNKMTRFIEKITSTFKSNNNEKSTTMVINNKVSTITTTTKNDALFDFEYKINLPIIDWTNGSLGILLPGQPIKVEKEESIFEHLLEFPIPPPSPTLFQHFNNKRRRRKRQDSCPPKFNSLIMIEESEDSDTESSILPLTPTHSTIIHTPLLKKTIEKFDILHIVPQ